MQWPRQQFKGLLFASLDVIEGTRTSRLVVSFEPRGSRSRLFEILHSAVPNDVLCTEYLTSYMELLPCKGKAEISRLLDGHRVFDTN